MAAHPVPVWQRLQALDLGDLTVGALNGTSDINMGFTLQSGYLVFFMQAGFAMLCAGSVRAKNAKNIILLNLLDACFGCIGWYITGWAFAFGDPLPGADGTFAEGVTSSPFIGHRFFCQNGLPHSMYGTWFFQFTFAATSATIVSGAVAERCKFECYVAYNLLLVSFVYPVVAHWVWSPFGWMSAGRTSQTSSGGYTLLFNSGVYDFAGDGPVHMVGGFASLTAAWILGPRIGRFDSAGSPVDMPGHNASLTLLGVFLLWFGWYGFNPGSTNAILKAEPGFSDRAAGIAVNTTIAAAGGCLSTMITCMLHQYWSLGVVVWDLIIAGNGALAGLVAITGGCAFVDTWAALVIGLLAGPIYYGCSKLILHRLKIDDPLDAIAVHAGCGAWGMLACAAFASQSLVDKWYGAYPGAPGIPSVTGREYGFIMGGSGNLLAAHLVYILVIAAWVLAIMTPFFAFFKRVGLMRVSGAIECAGLDISYHGGTSYPHEKAGVDTIGFATGATQKEMELLVMTLTDGLEQRIAAQERQIAELMRPGQLAGGEDQAGKVASFPVAVATPPAPGADYSVHGGGAGGGAALRTGNQNLAQMQEQIKRYSAEKESQQQEASRNVSWADEPAAEA